MNEITPQDASSQDESPQINPDYVLGQMAKAFTTSEQHADAEMHARAAARVEQWATVFQGILDGTINVGSRTPLAGVPSWATLEVVTGGFATGKLLAGGPLLEHEQQLLAEQPALASEGRTLLNAYFLSEPGLAALRAQLHSGYYEIDVPEEGALLVVAWLIEQGHGNEARALLAELGPYFAQLRFYPIPNDRPMPSGAQVFLQSVGSTIKALQRIDTNHAILAQKEAVEIWAPLYDEVVRLWLETVEGTPPTLLLDAVGKPVRDAKGWHVAEGGWPCRVYPENWALRAQRTLDEYHRLRQMHTLSGKPERNQENFAQLRFYLQRCVDAPLALTGRNVRWIRLLLAGYITKYGTPDSAQHRALRQQQTRQVDIPIYRDIAQIVVARLAAYDKEGGLVDLDAVTHPVSRDEAQQVSVTAETAIPRLIQGKLERSLIDSIQGLVARGVITSGDTLARVLPQITAEIRTAGIEDPTLRQLYAAVYRAFRRRRSLLLLNYESQVRIEELPWIAAIERFRLEYISTRELSRQTLEEVATLALTAFPYAILPNKLLRELRALAKLAHLDMPLVDEVAADIFMGDFSSKFLYAAQRAADLLEGTLYARYYGIDAAEVRQLREHELRTTARHQVQTGETLGTLCSRRAGVGKEQWSVARNGMIIEQQHILTTQNLAVLFATFGLAERLQGQLEPMARHCFEWICQRQQMKTDEWHGRLIMVKNTAYAWRQMIFFLSFLPADELQGFLDWATAHYYQQSETFQARFRPALNGLLVVAKGGAFDTLGVDHEQARRFLGWSMTTHWLLQ